MKIPKQEYTPEFREMMVKRVKRLQSKVLPFASPTVKAKGI